MALVSVLIPAYNAQKTIGETLKAAQQQTYGDLEIIVVDDGSTDETADIVSQVSDQDPRVSLIRQSNTGVAVARNTALARSKGSLIAPLDADDLWHPTKIERQVANLLKAPDHVGLDYCWFVDIDADSKITRCYMSRLQGDIYQPLIVGNFIGNSSVPLIRRTLLEQIGGWDPGLRAANAQGCEDWLLYLQIAERARAVLSPALLVGYRQLPQMMSRNVRQMTQSYELTMNYARASRPNVPEDLFAKSRRDFDLYISGIQDTTRTSKIQEMLAATRRDLGIRSKRGGFSSDLARGLLRTVLKVYHLGTNVSASIHGCHFGTIEPNTRCPICDPLE
ncbi:glycosyltransferase family A protein [Bradyrhizobium yuanmingense]|uniref:glycosyltransferase family 2 protein n=1 Tax=Bradyrhizobium yuanmingense TaxID=108015 RepID=UPI0023BA1A4A|nr:glycosyltransferase family A protein [Bradyrhizobium yuanmingense]MDF0516841.1 glycosyltransferase family A protein [Bradyrhizobium yuanmingense]